MKDIEIAPLNILLTLAGLVFCAVATSAGAESFSYGSTDGKSGNCLVCHENSKTIGARYVIDHEQYSHTSHARIGCVACHDTVSPKHPADGIASKRSDCSQCHGDTAGEYARSKHAAKASCRDCHTPHRVSAPQEISGQEMNRMCAGCHNRESMEARHATWLPQADLHLGMLPCVTCHTASENYLITLHVIKRDGDNRYGEFRPATFPELNKLAGGKDIRSLVDTNGDTYISLAELRLFNEKQDQRLFRLQGVMVPEKVTHDFQTLDNRWDCTFCHASGPRAMQRSTLALPEKNGTFTRLDVEKGAVLEALGSTPDFYMTGATRNGTLDRIGLAIIAGGLVMPVGHGFLRFLTRKNRKERSHRHE
ncbi:cytochrome c3 family protein [Geotalea toluenoxydans]